MQEMNNHTQNDRAPATGTHREWALFVLRWIFPIVVILAIGLRDELPDSSVFVVLATVVLLSLVSNIGMLALLLNHAWSRRATIWVMAFDVVLAVVVAYLGGSIFMWLALLPLLVVGFFFNWQVGFVAGLMVAACMTAVQLTLAGLFIQVDLASLILGWLVFPIIGPLISVLHRDESELIALRDRFRLTGQRAQQATRTAREYIDVLYDMSEVLSLAQLDPGRVLNTAVEESASGLERVGVRAPLYSAILLFAETPYDGLMLRFAAASATAYPSDRKHTVPGLQGALARTLHERQPVIIPDASKDPELSVFETFRMCKAALCLPLQAGNQNYGVMLIGSHEDDAFNDTHIKLAQAISYQSAAAIHNAQLYSSSLKQRDLIVDVEKSARAHLASELHDGPTQTVAAITMRVNLIRRLMDKKPERASEELYIIEDMAHRATKEIRQMLFELRPKAVEDGLGAGLQQLALKMQETYEQDVKVTVEHNCDYLLDPHAAQTLFSIATEAANNARKHSGAELIHISAYLEDDTFVLQVKDTGKGFNVEYALEAARMREGHLGLLNLQERAALMEGVLDIQSSEEIGTTLTVYIPLEVLRRRTEEQRRRTEDKSEPELIASQASQR